MSLPDDLAEALARAHPRLTFFGQVEWHETVTSTNDLAWKAAERGAGEGAVIAAHEQTAGRGRLGRVWVSPSGAGLYVSVILRPPPHGASLVTVAAGVALADGIEEATGLAPRLKWPNDVYVGERKLAGILAEGGAPPGAAGAVVLGFGINLRAAAYPPAVAARATSLEEELGRPVERGALLALCLASLAVRYDDVRKGRGGAVLASWRTRAVSMLGRRVEWDAADGPRRGIAQDIDEGGALLVRTEAGLERVISGEVRWTS